MKKFLRVSFFAFLTTAVYAQIPTTNLSLWLKADAGLTTTTGNIINSNWTDQSPNALVMTKSGSPTIITVSSLNGQRFVHFPGGSDFTNSSAIFNFTKFTFFAVARVTSGDIFYNNNYGFGYESGSNGRFYINATGSRAQYPNYLNNPAIFSGMYNLSSITGAVNTTVVSPFTYSSPINASSTFYVANGYGLLNGDIAELIIYNTDLTLTQKDQVYNYLAVKYNIGINPNAPTISSFATTNSLLDIAFVGTMVAASGYGGGGDNVSVAGTNFTSVTGVFVNNIPVASYTVTSPISISFTLPDGLSYPDNDLTGKIKIVNNYGPGISTQDLQVIYTNVTPSSNFNVIQNGSFQIVGSDISQINLISIGGINVPFSYNSSTKRIIVNVTTAVGLGAQSIVLSQNTYLGNQLYTLDPVQAIVATILPSPIITSVTPSKGIVGSSVILAGSGFASTPSDNTVYFGGVQANITAASATSVTVNAPAGVGYQNISLLNFNSNGQTQANASYVNTFLGGGLFTANTFGPEISQSFDAYGYFSTIADLNNDGKPEMITSHKYSNRITIFQNQTSNNTISSSSFPATPVYLNTTSQSYQVIARDFDNDGKLDLAVYNYGGSIQIFRNVYTAGAITSGSFANPITIAVPVGGYALDAADIDGDGKIDIALAAHNNVNNTLYILKNQFSGNTIIGSSFASAVTISFGTGAYPVDLKLVDIDNDGKIDLATANQSNSGNSYISIFRNITPNISIFNTPVSVSLPNTFNYTAPTNMERLNSLEWADFDNDGKLDLVATNRSINSISVFKNKSIVGTINGSSFNERYDYSTGITPQGLAVGDLNGDGKVDVAVACDGERKFTIFKNQAVNGTLTGASFASGFDFAIANNNSAQIQINDLDNDGKPEIIITNIPGSYNSVFKNLITDPPTITGFSPSSGLANSTIVTINGTGFVNITTVGFGTGSTNIFTVVNTNTIVARLPLTATTGLISVINLTGGIAYSSSSITVTPAAVPSITGFSPVNGSVGSFVVISGSGFDALASNNAVFIGRIQASVTGANTNSLTVIVPSDATYDLIRVTNLSSSLGAESKIPFNVTFAGPNTITSASFAPKTDVTADYYVYQTLFADIDGDGNSDMLSANYASNTFSVYRNTGTGTNLLNQFAPRVNFSTGISAYKLAVADFDGDGKLDVVVSNYSSNTISVFRNISSLGNIAFTSKVDFSTGANPSGIEVADFDKDGSIDIAVVNYNTNFISVFKNNNITGTITGLSFLPRQDYTSQYYAYNLAITDIDGDGYPDIATATQNTNTISILRNQSINGAISFSPKVDITSQYYPWDIKFSDFDADGKSDLVVSNSSYSTISILRNQSTVGTITSASFAARVDFNANSTPYGLTLGDVDGDGRVDIATSYGSSGFVSVLRNTSTASGINASTLAPKVDFLGAGTSSYYPSLGDIDGDGKLELAIPNYQYSTISLFRNLSGPGPTLTGFALTSGQAGVDLFSITGNSLSNINTIWVGSGFTTSQFTIVGSNLIIAKVPAGATTGAVSVVNSFGVTATAPGIYTISIPYPYPSITGIAPTKGFVGTSVQINGLNFATSTGGNLLYFGSVKVPVQTAATTQLVATVPGGTSFADIKLLNTVTGLATSYNLPFVNTFVGANTITASAFGNKTDLNVSSTPYASALADLDGDGKPELISSEYSSNAISVFRNIGSVGTIGGGSFAARQSFSTASNPYEIVAADIDSDGKPDLLIANYSGSSISIFRNISSGPGNIAFATRFDLALPGSANNLAVGDLDLDGYLDIVSSNRSINSISIFKNRGLTGTVAGASFDTRLDIPSGSGPYDLEIADINGDAKPEILIVYSSFLGVYHNKTSIGNINSASFSNAMNFSGLSTAYCVKAADMDGDNRLDIIIGDYGNNRLAWFRNLGLTSTISGSSLSTLQFLTGFGNPAGLALADFDGDGKVDVASGNYGSGNVVSLWKNISTIGGVAFASYANLQASGFNNFLSAGDIDGDGKPDLLVPNYNSNSISVFRNVIAQPSISGFNPSIGQAGIDRVTLTGSGLDVVSALSIGAGTTQTFISATSNTLVFKLPAFATTGQIVISSSFGVTVTSAGVFTISAPFPYPTITGITPLRDIQNATISISGQNFSTVPGNNIVFIGSAMATVTGSSINSVIAKVPSAATYDRVSLLNKDYELTGFFQNSFATTFTGGGTIIGSTFSPALNISGSGTPYFSSIKDLDGDGKPEIITANYGSSTITINKNTTANTTITASSLISFNIFHSFSNPLGIAVDDLDNDGKPDIVISNYSNSSISIYKNNYVSGVLSAANFSGPFTYAVGTQPYSLAIGDLDNDGRNDIAVANYGSATISLLKNIGTTTTITNSSFAAKSDIILSYNPYAVALGDLDADGRLDIAIGTNSLFIPIIKNIGTQGSLSSASFASAINQSVSYNTFAITIGDLNGDLKPEIISGSLSYAFATILQNNTSGNTITGTSFNSATYLNVPGTGNTVVSLGDIDGDGKIDLAGASYSGTNRVFAFRNNLTSTGISAAAFSPRVDYAISYNPIGANLADLDGDAKPDLIITNYNGNGLSIYKNLTVPPPTVTGFNPQSGIAGLTYVSITGLGFNSTTAVGIGGFSASYSLINDNLIVAKVSPSAITGLITVTNVFFASGISTQAFTITGAFPYPTVTSVIPNVAAVGDAIIINGNNFGAFTSQNDVYFGNVKANVTSASANSLQVTVPIAAEFKNIRLTNKANYLTTEFNFPFTPTFTGMNTITGAAYAPRIDQAIGVGAAYRLAVGDLDGDGKMDVITGTYNSSYISIFRNISSPGTWTGTSFATRVDINVGYNYFHEIELADIDQDGKLDIVAANYNSSSVFIIKNNSTSGNLTAASFSTPVQISGPLNTYAIEVADFNNDGFLDLAAGSSGSTIISIYTHNGTVGTITGQTYATKMDLNNYNNCYDLEAMDLNGDGLIDLAAANYVNNNISLFQNSSVNNSISFRPAITFSVSQPLSVKAADIDRDGKLDLVAGSYGSANVYVFKNNLISNTITSTSFGNSGTGLTFATGNTNYGIDVFDMDGDGRIDIMSGNHNSNTISILRNTGAIGTITSQSFATKVDLATGAYPSYVLAEDMDGDSKPDIIVPNANSSTFSVIRNNLSFNPTVTGFTPSSGSAFTIISISGTNLNTVNQVSIGGGVTSIITVLGSTGLLAQIPLNATTGNVVVTNTQGSTSTAPGVFTVNPLQVVTITSIAPATANVGTTLVINGNNFSTVVGNNTVILGSVKASVTSASATSLSVTIPSGTNYNSLTVFNSESNSTGFYEIPFVNLFNGIGTFTGSSLASTVDFGTNAYPNYGVVKDMDGDGKQDLIVTNLSGNTITVLRNTSVVNTITSSSLATYTSFNVLGNPRVIAVGDLDNDTKPDVVVAYGTGSSISVFKNNSSSGSFTTGSLGTRIDLGGLNVAIFVEIEDIDLDGQPDIIVANYNAGNVAVFRNKGTGQSLNANSFDNPVFFTVGTQPRSISVGDIDNDGKPDIAVANYSSSNVSLLRNTSTIGGISFRPTVNLAANSLPFGLEFADFDGDGWLDIVASNYNSNNISVYHNRSLNGTITGASFAPKIDFVTASNPNFVNVGDIDGDGKPEIAVASNGNFVSIFRNTTSSTTITASSFAPKVDIAAASAAPQHAVIADIDNDNAADLVVLNANLNTISVRRNLSNQVGSVITITSVNPVSQLQGQQITLNGQNFVAITGVTISGISSSYTLINVNIVLATIPGSATSGFVSVTGFGGNIAVSPSQLTVIPFLVPTITGFNPLSGFPGSEISVLGNNFVSITGISISGINSQFTIVNSQLALVTVPSSILSGKATIVNYSGQTQSVNIFTVTSSITGFSPGTVLAGSSTIVTISGIGFTSVAGLTFGGSVPALYTVTGLNQILALVPVSATTGNIVLINNGISITSTGVITVTPRPVPIISSITPLNGVLGTFVTLSGTNFSTVAGQNIVSFGAVYANVLSNSATSVVVSIPSGVNYQQITLVNSVTGLQAFANQSFITTFLPAGTITATSFAPRVNFNGFSNPNELKLTDLDGDGKPDLIAGNISTSNISVARNTSSLNTITASSFASAVTFSTISAPSELLIKDIDNDGKPDVLVHNSSGNFSILKNTSSIGSISFAPKVDVILSIGSYGFAADDLDGDGFMDIVISDQSNSRVVLLRNSGVRNVINAATFNSISYMNTLATADKVVIKDLDNDGKNDLVVSANSTQLKLFKNISRIGQLDATSFASPVNISSANTIEYLFAYDVDLDGKQDLLAGAFSAGRLLIFKNQASGATLTGSSFASEVTFNTGTNPFGITMDDFDGDAKPDVVLANYSSNTIGVYRNLSNPGTINSASLAAPLNLATGLNPSFPASGDLDGDGKPEIVVPNYGTTSVSVFQNLASPPLNSVISTINPAFERQGRSITLNGINFTNVISVMFGGGVNSLFNVLNSTVLVVTVPGGSITGPLTVTNLAGIGVSSQVFTVISTPSPSVTGLNPAFAIAGNLITATIGEFEFLQGPVTIGGAAISAYTVSGSTLSFIVPISAITGDVRIKTLYGGISPTIAGSLLTILPPPSITNFGTLNPIYGPKIAASGCGGMGDIITITGNGFAPGSTAITINNFNVIISTVTSNLIYAVLPDLSGYEGQNLTGKIKVTTPAGNVSTTQDIVALFCTLSPTTTVGLTLGGSFQVTGNDLLNVNTASVAGVATSFSFNSGTGKLTVNVPFNAPSGNINVTLGQGSYFYNFPFSFYIYPKPTITGVMPSPAAVGQLISITGFGLSSTTGIIFSGSSTTLVSNISDNLITLTVPANTNNGYFTVLAFGGSAVSSVQFLVAPSVTGLNPAANGVGKLVDISGYSLNGVTKVLFNGVSAPINSKNSTNINVSVPIGATSGNVIVIAPGYTSPGIFFKVIPPPVITNITPGSAVAGTIISIIGANFSLSGTNTVSFNGTGTAIGTIIGDNLLIVNVPQTASTGYITVSNNGGSTTSNIQFVVIPQLTGVFNPTTGGAGLTIAIFGTNLLNPSLVRFNGVAAGSFTSISASQVNASIPVIATGGPVLVDVTTDGGTSNQVVFTILGAPSITSFSSGSGVAGDIVTVIGNNFDSGTNTVLINGANTSVTTISKTVLKVVVPGNVSVGIGQIQVQNAGNVNQVSPNNYATSPSNFTTLPSLYAIKDECFNVTLTSAIQGQMLKFEGANFLSGTQVFFNGMLANPISGSYHCFGSYTFLNSNTLYVIVPAGATSGNVTVKTLGGTSNNYPFIIIPPPTLSTFSPLTGVAGTEISVTGTGFATVTGVAFAGVNSPFTILNSTLLVTTVPGSASNGKISVTAYGGTGQSSINFTPIPVITGINYYEAPIGSNIQLTGTNLYSPTDIDFSGSSNAVSFSNFVTGVTVQVPADANSGFITFTNAGGTTVSPFSFTVSTITGISTTTGIASTIITVTGIGISNASSFQFAGTSTFAILSTAPGIVVVSVPDVAGQGPIRLNFPNGGNTSSIIFNPTPVITSIAPNTHGTSQYVNILGTNLREVIAASFNGPLSSSLGFASGSNRNSVQVPVNALSGIVTVTISGGGVATSPSSFTVISISGVLPAICLGGTEITILGANLDNPSAITIGGTTVAGINPASNFSRIITTVPSSISSAQIIVYKGGGFNDSFFLNLPDASITGINPTFGPYGTIITISGNNFTNSRNVFLYNASHTPFSYALPYNVLSVTRIVATIPGTAITGNVRVTGQNNNTANGPLFTLPPTLTTLTAPAILPAGQTVVLNGSNLTAPTTINVGGIAVPVTSYGSGSITFTIPASAGTGIITAGNISGSSQISFNLLSITSLSATSGVSGFIVTINGTSLNSLTGVKFNGVSASFTGANSNMATAIVPTNAGNGKISVLANGYEVQSAATFNPIPVITGFVVINGIDATTAKTGSIVSLTGTNLNNVNYVRFQTSSNRYDTNPFLNPCYTGNYSTYLYPLCITSDAASGMIVASNGLFTDSFAGFNFVGLPGTITDVAAIPGSQVTIDGTNLNTVTSLSFGGVPALAYNQIGTTRVIANISPNATISGSVAMQTLGGNTSSIYTAPPIITSLSQSAGAVGINLQVFGYNFTNGQIAFSGATATGSNFGGYVSVTVPLNATTGYLSLTNAAGTGSSNILFNVLSMPTITGFTPANGEEGTLVIINGVNLESITGVTFGNGTQNATFTGISSTQIQAYAPPGVLSGKIGVSNPSIYPVTVYSVNNYLGSPIFTSVINTSNNNASYIGAIGDVIQINGSNFTNPSVVLFNGVASGSITFNSMSQLLATVPAGATSGLITVSTPGGNLSTPNSFSVVSINTPIAVITNSCTGSTFAVNYTVSGLFPSDNVFTVDLMNGGTVVQSAIGTRTAFTSGVVNAIVPAVNAGIYQVRIRSNSASTNYQFTTSNSNGINITNINNWIGNTDNWSLPTNWGCNILPTSASYVIIPSIAPGGNMPVIYGSAVTGQLQVQGTLSITTSGILTLHGNMSLAGVNSLVAEANSYTFVNEVITFTSPNLVELGNLNINANKYLTLNTPVSLKGSLVNYSTVTNSYYFQGLNTNGFAVTVEGVNFQTVGTPAIRTTFDELYLNNPYTGAGVAFAGPVYVRCKLVNLGIFNANGFLTEFINGPCSPVIIASQETYFHDIVFSNTVTAVNIATPIRVRGNFKNSPGAMGITMTSVAGVDFVGTTEPQVIEANGQVLAYQDFNVDNPMGVSLSTVTSTNIRIRGNFRNNGSFTDRTNTVSFTGISSTIGGTGDFNLNNVEVASGAAVTLARPVRVRGNFRGNGLFSPGGQTVTFNAGSSGQTISGTSIVDFSGIEITDSTRLSSNVKISVGGDIQNSGSVTVTSAMFVGNATQSVGGAGNYLFGDVMNTNATGVTINASSEVTGNLVNNGSFSVADGNVTSFTGTSQTISGSVVPNLSEVVISSSSGVTLNQGIKVRGNFKTTGTFVPNNQPVNFAANGGQTIESPNPVNFAAIKIEGNTQVASNTALNVSGSISNDGSLTISQALTFSGAATQTVSGSGVISVGDVMNTNASSTIGLQLDADVAISGNLLNNSTLVSTQDLKFTGSMQTVSGVASELTNVEITPSSSVTLNSSVKLRGNLNNNSVSMGIVTNSMVTLEGQSTQTIGGASPTTLAEVVQNNPSGIVVEQPITVSAITLAGGNITLSGVAPLLITSTDTAALVRKTEGYVVGAITRRVVNPRGRFTFPAGTADSYRGAVVDFTTSATGSGEIAVSHTDAFPAVVPGVLQPFDTSLTNLGIETVLPLSWKIEPSISLTGGTYSVSLDAQLAGNTISDPSVLKLVKRHTVNDLWMLPGTDGIVDYNVSTQELIISRSSITGFSEYAIAGSCANVSNASTLKPVITQVGYTLMSLTPGSIFEWSRDGVVQRTLTGQNVEPTKSGLYRVRIKQYGCATGTSDPIDFTAPVITTPGFPDPTPPDNILTGLNEAQVSIYPNPTASKFCLLVSNTKEGRCEIVIYDLVGKQVQNHSFELRGKNNFNEAIDVSPLANGIYIVQVSVAKKNRVMKLTITK